MSVLSQPDAETTAPADGGKTAAPADGGKTNAPAEAGKTDAPAPAEAGKADAVAEKEGVEKEAEAPELPDKGTTTFVFTNLVFKAPGAKFIGTGPARTPMFSIDLGDTAGTLTIQALRRQFKIPFDSPDDKMIALAVRSLNYVAEIRPGDNVPNEILTGKASWSIDPKHTEVARRRLELQLLSSVDKDVDNRPVLHDTKEITAYLERPENKPKLRQAFRDAAMAMGRPEDDTAYVLTQLGAFARELAYIEALREWFLQVGSINKKVPLVQKSYDNDKRIKGELIAMQALMPSAIREYRGIFTALDAESMDVIAALKEIDKKIAIIREGRDKLHNLTLVWKDIVAEWKGFTVANAGRYLDAAQSTYRFLAARHSSGRSLLSSFTQPNALKSAIKAPELKSGLKPDGKPHDNPLMRPDAGVAKPAAKPKA